MKQYKAIKHQDHFVKGDVYEFEKVNEFGQDFYSHTLELDDEIAVQVLIPENKFFDYFQSLEQDVKEKKQENQSFGEMLVGKSFNPSNDSKVDKLKYHFAEISNIIKDHESNEELDILHPNKGTISTSIYLSCISDILKAQMMCVKFVTLNK